MSHFRISASINSIQNVNISWRSQSKSLEEKLGLPPRPKKPLTPYFRFLKDARPKMLQSNPNLKAIELVQACAKKWVDVDENTKKKLLDEYMKDKEQYVIRRAHYESRLTDDQKFELEAAKQDIVESREKREHRKVKKNTI